MKSALYLQRKKLSGLTKMENPFESDLRPGWKRQPPAPEADVKSGSRGDRRKPPAASYGTRPLLPGLKRTAR